MTSPRVDPAEEARRQKALKERNEAEEMWARFKFDQFKTQLHHKWYSIDTKAPDRQDPSLALMAPSTIQGKLAPGVYAKADTDTRLVVDDKGRMSVLGTPDTIEDFRKSYGDLVRALVIQQGRSSLTIDWPERGVDLNDDSVRKIMLERLEVLLDLAEQYSVRVDLGPVALELLGKCESSVLENLGVKSEKMRADGIFERLQELDQKHKAARSHLIPYQQAITVETLGKAIDKVEPESKLIEDLGKAAGKKKQLEVMGEVEAALNDILAKVTTIEKDVKAFAKEDVQMDKEVLEKYTEVLGRAEKEKLQALDDAINKVNPGSPEANEQKQALLDLQTQLAEKVEAVKGSVKEKQDKDYPPVAPQPQ